jgi:hypothetical protein
MVYPAIKSIKQQYTAKNGIGEDALARTGDQTSFRRLDNDGGRTHNNQEK